MDMGTPITNNKTAFLKQIHTLIHKRAKKALAEPLYCFAEEFFDQYPLEDLAGTSLDDIYGMIAEAYEFIEKVIRRAPKIRVYNPEPKDNGWQSAHTIVMVHCDNMPFLMDSVRMSLANYNTTIYSLKSTPMAIKRSEEGAIDALEPSMEGYDTEGNEALLYFEINHLTKAKELKAIETTIRQSLQDIKRVTNSYKPIQKHVQLIADELNKGAHTRHGKAEVAQARDFIEWLKVNSFTFLGYAYFALEGKKKSRKMEKSLGLLEGAQGHSYISESLLESPKTEKSLITFAKSPTLSTVHRRTYPDHIIIKAYDEGKKLVGEHHLVGLYTSSVYRASVLSIPLVRDKVEQLYKRMNINMNSYNGRAIRQVLETYPRDELFQSSAEELTETILGVSQINERHQVRLFLRKDWVGDFVYAMVYIPRDVFSSELRSDLVNLIGSSVGAEASDFYTYYSESILSRTYIVFRLKKDPPQDWSTAQLEQQVKVLARTWYEDLRDDLKDCYGEEEGDRFFKKYSKTFSRGYQENFQSKQALADIERLEQIDQGQPLIFNLCEPATSSPNLLRFQIFNQGAPLTLSDIIPVLERMGFRVIGEHPYRLKLSDSEVWLHDFELKSSHMEEVDFVELKLRVEDAFTNIWLGNAENDTFNGLVLATNLHWREVVILRAYAAYMKQTLFPLSKRAINQALLQNPKITELLAQLFQHYFDPNYPKRDAEGVYQKIIQALDSVSNLNDDRIIRRYLDLIQGTVRTNYYQAVEGQPKDYISFKFTPRAIPDIPEPRPLYEIFVFSPKVEGVHLRGGKVARGGLRWSDRFDDFRTEVLGLVKAQQVKNAVIVPNGAKGGFIAKHASKFKDREGFLKEGIACYQTFIRGLLDITDNLVKGKIIPPKQVLRRDEDDPYLVVAADKGTATFSDIANEISTEYGHWLGDAFASGGSQGYDHKGMGITARGAWVSVQRHFKEKGINVQEEDFTAIGIGDMGGDVFGNGMLMSEHICLTAAFNHLHIFIDPNPDAAKSFKERQRLFNTPRTTWADYDSKLISKGGGIFSRDAKSISISPEMKARFAIKASKLTPTDLITALLKAPVDLIWNGGIGTYVKASSESHGEIGDKANDGLRVNGADLRCKVFGEGGNLGLSQQGRIEFAATGGACNTDFIDNAAGVDCSDHEVNIKILLNELVVSGTLSEKQRNRLLASMTDTVATMVLRNNYEQTQSISIAEKEAVARAGEYRRLINTLESNGQLDRALEFIPSDDALLERSAEGKSLTRPELSVLNCYVKGILKEAFAEDEIAENNYMKPLLERAFPKQLVDKYNKLIQNHQLRKEIIATQLANDMVNNMGITFYHRLIESTGEAPATIALAYLTARDIFQFDDFQAKVEALDYQADASAQAELMGIMIRRVRRGTRWFLRNRRGQLNPGRDVDTFKPLVEKVIKVTPEVLNESEKERWTNVCQHFQQLGLSEETANILAMPGHLFSGLSMVEACVNSGFDIKLAVSMHHLLGNDLNLYWFAGAVTSVPVENYWQGVARESIIDDIDRALMVMTVSLLKVMGKKGKPEAIMALWQEDASVLINRWRQLTYELQTSASPDFAMFSVALRELNDLVDSCQHYESPGK